VSELDRALLAVIGERTGRRDLEFAQRPRPVTGGYSAEVLFFSLAAPPRGFGGELVLRRMDVSPRARVEIAVQRAVSELGFPAPRVRAAGLGELLGRPYMVMDRVTGTTFGEMRGVRTRLRSMRTTPQLLADAQARLHSLPVEPFTARLRERGVDPEALSTDSLLGELRAQIHSLGAAELAHALAWLDRTRPPERRAVLCHGDVHPNNLIVGDDGSWALIDWTNARLAEPEFDVAFTAELLELAPVDVPWALRPVVQLALRHASRRFQASYAAVAELDSRRVTWYQALYRLRLLVRIAASRAALPDAPTLPSDHPWRAVAPLAAARLRAAVLS
jgi:aminoglycoside phosphotransferase (APT) family kinase protein